MSDYLIIGLTTVLSSIITTIITTTINYLINKKKYETMVKMNSNNEQLIKDLKGQVDATEEMKKKHELEIEKLRVELERDKSQNEMLNTPIGENIVKVILNNPDVMNTLIKDNLLKK